MSVASPVPTASPQATETEVANPDPEPPDRGGERSGWPVRRQPDREDPDREDMVAARAYHPGDLIFEFSEMVWWPVRDVFTVEYVGGRHFFDPQLARVAHACDPNARVSFTLMALVARRDIAPGEALTFDYFTTESAISAPFVCHCGASNCRGWIAGPDLPPLTVEF